MKIKCCVSSFSVFLLSVLLLSGCENTVEGFGKDMQKTGQAIQKSVNDK